MRGFSVDGAALALDSSRPLASDTDAIVRVKVVVKVGLVAAPKRRRVEVRRAAIVVVRV